ncbi:MAG: hypothetical protein U9R07_14335 [Pseudomonadota bacterium]|nr:hypothetical protein [Pseudomonadota bacterium]
MTKWKTQSISALVFPQTIEGIDFRTLEHSLYRRQANSLIAKFLGKGHECGKTMCMTACTPILKEVQYFETLPQLGQGQGATLVTIFIDPPDILQRRGRQTHNSRFHEALRWRLAALNHEPQVC